MSKCVTRNEVIVDRIILLIITKWLNNEAKAFCLTGRIIGRITKSVS